jgi:hypothetical protein
VRGAQKAQGPRAHRQAHIAHHLGDAKVEQLDGFTPSARGGIPDDVDIAGLDIPMNHPLDLDPFQLPLKRMGMMKSGTHLSSQSNHPYWRHRAFFADQLA